MLRLSFSCRFRGVIRPEVLGMLVAVGLGFAATPTVAQPPPATASAAQRIPYVPPFQFTGEAEPGVPNGPLDRPH